MSQIEQCLKSLTKNQKELLDYAFENSESQYVVINKVIFVGVNVASCPGLTIKETKGVWSYGTINL